MVNYISHRYIAEAEEVKSEKRYNFNLSQSAMSTNASTVGSEAELSPRSSEDGGDHAFSTHLNVIIEKGESMYEPAQHLYTDDEVDNLRAKLDAKSQAIGAEADRIQAISAKADGV